MLNWKRPQGMPATEPSEEQIWEIIEAHDPKYSASIRDHLSWHQEMLEERNIYGNIFNRSSRMPISDMEISSEYNPANWITSTSLRHIHDNPAEKFADRLVYGTQEILQPASDSRPPPGIVRSLSYYILDHQADDWEPKSKFGTSLAAIKGYADWARFHLQMHHRMLKKAGVYQAIYASLFDYSRLPFTWIRGIAEHWDNATNTCWIGPHEMTITMADIQDISGLPVFGTPYEECIPPDHELFRRYNAEGQKRGSFVYPSALHRALEHYQKLFRDKRKGQRRVERKPVTLDMWSQSFLRKGVHLVPYARLNDPFDMGAQSSEDSFKKRYEPEGAENVYNVLAQNVDEDVSLVAFIATWLCSFVFPTRNGIFRPATLLMASLIARGERISLGPAALAYLYHGLGRVGKIKCQRNYDVEAPWHYLHGWVHMHFSGSFTIVDTPRYFKEQQYPIIMQLSNATSAFDTVQIRAFMFAPLRMTGRFELIHQSKLQNIRNQDIDCPLEDAMTENNTPILLSDRNYLRIAEYFIGIRPSWLYYRQQSFVMLEGYHPNRVARQYGFTQATPTYGLPPIYDIDNAQLSEGTAVPIRLRAASEAWTFLLRLGTGSRFYIAPRNASTGISHLWLAWINQTYASFLDKGCRIYCSILRNRQNGGHSQPAKKPPLDESPKRKRQEKSPPVYEDCETSHRGENCKRIRSGELSDHRNPSLDKSLPRSEESVPVHSSSPIYNTETIEVVEIENPAQNSLPMQHTEAGHDDMVQDEPLAQCIELEENMNIGSFSPIHDDKQDEVLVTERAIRDKSPVQHQESVCDDMLQEEPMLQCIEPETDHIEAACDDIVQDEPLAHSIELETDVNMNNVPPVYNEVPAAENTIQDDLTEQHVETGCDDRVPDEPLLQHIEPELNENAHTILSAHVNQAMDGGVNSASLSIRQNAIEDAPLSFNEERRHEEPEMIEDVQNMQQNQEGRSSVSASTPTMSYRGESLLRESEEVYMTSATYYSTESEGYDSLEGHSVAAAEEGSSLSRLTQSNTTNVPEESRVDTILENVGEEGQTSPCAANISRPLRDLKVESFVSGIKVRTAGSFGRQLVKTLENAIKSLREFVLEINLEMLQSATEFCELANCLLDFAVCSGISAEDLQHWDSVMRQIEYDIYSIQIAREEGAIEKVEAAQLAHKDISDRAMSAYDNLQEKYIAARKWEKCLTGACAAVSRIDMELEEIKQRERDLVIKKEIIKQDIEILEANVEGTWTEVVELENISNPLSQQLEVATQHLQVIQDKYEFSATRAKAAVEHIRKIQARCA